MNYRTRISLKNFDTNPRIDGAMLVLAIDGKMPTAITYDKAERKASLLMGRLISHVNLVEAWISQTIADYYIKPDTLKNTEFVDSVLQGGAVTLDGKISIIYEIAANFDIQPTKTIKSDIMQWRQIRNVVAHGILLYDSERSSPYIRHKGEMHDIDKLLSGFVLRQKRILRFLDLIRDKLAEYDRKLTIVS